MCDWLSPSYPYVIGHGHQFAFILLLLFWPCQVARGILVLQLGIKPEHLHWECRVLTNGPPGKSESLCHYFIIICLHGMA